MNKFKNIFSAGLLLVAGLGLVGCSSLSPGGGSKGNSYDPQIKANFMNSCESSSDGLTAYCGCVWDAVTAKFSQDEFVVIDRWFADGTGSVSQEDQDFLENTFVNCAAAHVPNN